MNEFSEKQTDSVTKINIKENIKEYKIEKENYKERMNEIKNEIKEENNLLKLKDVVDYDDHEIDYYKLKYLEELKKNYIINGNKLFGDMNIFINQKSQRGRMLDLAYVYGDKNNKTFIGFQMKAYDEESSHDCSFNSSKAEIKSILKPMLINIQYLLGMIVKSWHFVAIIFQDNEKPEGKQYFKKLVENCKKNGLEYIFYDPFENKFYNRDRKFIDKFTPTQYSNLDNDIENILPINIMDCKNIEKYMVDIKNYIEGNKKDKAGFIKDGLVSLMNKKRKREKEKNLNFNFNEIQKDVDFLLANIRDLMELKFFFKSVKFVGAYKYQGIFNIPTPKINYFFLIPTISDNVYFISFNESQFIEQYYEIRLDEKVGIQLNDDNIDKKIKPAKEKDLYKYIDKHEQFYVFKYQPSDD